MRRAILLEIDRLHRGIGLTGKLSRIFRERNFTPRDYSIPPQTFWFCGLCFYGDDWCHDGSTLRTYMEDVCVAVGGPLIFCLHRNLCLYEVIPYSRSVVLFNLSILHRWVLVFGAVYTIRGECSCSISRVASLQSPVALRNKILPSDEWWVNESLQLCDLRNCVWFLFCTQCKVLSSASYFLSTIL